MTHQDSKPLTGTPALAQDLTAPEEIRRAAGLTAEEMAALLGMGDYGYSAWERGARTPGGPALKLLALIATDPIKMIAALRKAYSSSMFCASPVSGRGAVTSKPYSRQQAAWAACIWA